jgi:transposase-like protein
VAVPQRHLNGRFCRSFERITWRSSGRLVSQHYQSLKSEVGRRTHRLAQSFTQWQTLCLPVGRRSVFQSRNEDDRQCILVVIGVTDTGDKELLGLEAGFRESELNWKILLLRLVAPGLKTDPELAVGDGALGFWKALAQVFPLFKFTSFFGWVL